ncbi:hypothetical protein ABPG74_005605 [Tetrahymena malaccensis]
MNISVFEEGQIWMNWYEQNSMDMIWSVQDKGNLWLGSLIAAQKIEQLQEQNIKAVITIAEGTKLKYPETLIPEHLVINAQDVESYDIKQHFDECIEFIERNINYGSVLVHCMAGVSRSASIVIAFLMKINRWNMEKAYKHAHSKRKQVSPNYGFLKQLRDYEYDLKLSD